MKKWIIISIIAAAILIGAAAKVYIASTEPVKAASEKAFERAKEETALERMDSFTLYHGQETFYVLQGQDKAGTKLIVWVPEKKGKPVVKNAKDGISKQEAIDIVKREKQPKEIISAKLGMEKGFPLWEVYYRSNGGLINYYYIHFETGEMLKRIENL